jgi:hypothetical protein
MSFWPTLTHQKREKEQDVFWKVFRLRHWTVESGGELITINFSHSKKA